MKLLLARRQLERAFTIGEILLDDAHECWTLEDTVRSDGIKIFGETAIPAGLYDVDLTYSPRFDRVLPLLLNVQGFVGIRIHPGNSAGDTEGCILVGRDRLTSTIGHSVLAFEALLTKLLAAHSRREPITLSISN